MATGIGSEWEFAEVWDVVEFNVKSIDSSTTANRPPSESESFTTAVEDIIKPEDPIILPPLRPVTTAVKPYPPFFTGERARPRFSHPLPEIPELDTMPGLTQKAPVPAKNNVFLWTKNVGWPKGADNVRVRVDRRVVPCEMDRDDKQARAV
ncbi:hypothetical protein C8035_v000272 [Colletotrichum spinosum]|uniref:Uncharacterized protein n=1 Tax=Colletotrichum spinosum TaxID=1347390 RepID=A0A4R8PMD8_9PEZI|nr:hypothetical protein C8035_v000272 [Colletotrichum spinosum]